MFALLDGLEFTARERERVMRSALAARSLAEELALAAKPSQLHERCSRVPLEAVALAGALARRSQRPAPPRPDWLERLRHVRLPITGDDLLAAGVPAGPEIGRRLDATLARKLDGELADGREAELSAALEARCERHAEASDSTPPPVSRRARVRAAGWRARAVHRARGTATCRASAATVLSTARQARERLRERIGVRRPRARPPGARHGRAAGARDAARGARRRRRRRGCAASGIAPERPRADGQATALAGVGAMVLAADCLPVALGCRRRGGDAPRRLARPGGRRARGGRAGAARARRGRLTSVAVDRPRRGGLLL